MSLLLVISVLNYEGGVDFGIILLLIVIMLQGALSGKKLA